MGVGGYSYLYEPLWWAGMITIVGSLRTPTRKLAEFLHRAVDLTLVPSVALAKELEAARVTAGNKIRLWNKGVDSESFHPKYRSQEMRIRLSNGEPERPLIVHVGRLGVEKSLDLLKMSWTRYSRHELLLLEMDHTDLEKLFSGMPAVFTGMSRGEELSQVYASGDVFVMPLELETLGHIMSFSKNRGISYSKLANLSPIVGLCELKLNLAVGPVSIATSFCRMNT
ncbi:unnamed protein product [Camellia sinensis]